MFLHLGETFFFDTSEYFVESFDTFTECQAIINFWETFFDTHEYYPKSLLVLIKELGITHHEVYIGMFHFPILDTVLVTCQLKRQLLGKGMHKAERQ